MFSVLSEVGGIQARACLKWPPSWPGRERGPISRGHVWNPDGGAGAGTFKEGRHLLCVQGLKKRPGVRGKRGCSPQSPAPVSVYESLPTPTPTPLARSLVHSIPTAQIPHLAENPKLAPGWSRSRHTQLPPVSLPESTSSLPPPCPLLGPCLHPQTIISED